MKTVKKKLKLKDISKTDIINIVDIMSEFCAREIGVNRRKKRELIFNIEKKDPTNPKVYGYHDHDDNEIYIFKKRNKTLDNFIKTFIHEYTHYLQPCKTHYQRLLEKHGYEKHPYEIEAFGNEDRYFKLAYKEVKKLLTLS